MADDLPVISVTPAACRLSPRGSPRLLNATATSTRPSRTTMTRTVDEVNTAPAPFTLPTHQAGYAPPAKVDAAAEADRFIADLNAASDGDIRTSIGCVALRAPPT